MYDVDVYSNELDLYFDFSVINRLCNEILEIRAIFLNFSPA